MSSLSITPSQLDMSKKKKIGKLHGNPVFAMATKGGLNMVVERTAQGIVVLGAGPHPAVSRKTAMANHPDLAIDELSKSEEAFLVSPELIKYWTSFTEKLNEGLDG